MTHRSTNEWTKSDQVSGRLTPNPSLNRTARRRRWRAVRSRPVSLVRWASCNLARFWLQ